MEQDIYSKISSYTDIVIFVIVTLVEVTVLLIRRFKLDFASLLTMLLYFIAILTRFLRSILIDASRISPVQLGINVASMTLISMTMAHFVYEMQAVRFNIEGGH